MDFKESCLSCTDAVRVKDGIHLTFVPCLNFIPRYHYFECHYKITRDISSQSTEMLEQCCPTCPWVTFNTLLMAIYCALTLACDFNFLKHYLFNLMFIVQYFIKVWSRSEGILMHPKNVDKQLYSHPLLQIFRKYSIHHQTQPSHVSLIIQQESHNTGVERLRPFLCW